MSRLINSLLTLAHCSATWSRNSKSRHVTRPRKRIIKREKDGERGRAREREREEASGQKGRKMGKKEGEREGEKAKTSREEALGTQGGRDTRRKEDLGRGRAGDGWGSLVYRNRTCRRKPYRK